MDDYKRALYMEAHRRLDAGEDYCVCVALKNALVREGMPAPVAYHMRTHLFSEFMLFYDGYEWSRNESSSPISTYSNMWWESFWKEPRVSALDCILRDWP